MKVSLGRSSPVATSVILYSLSSCNKRSIVSLLVTLLVVIPSLLVMNS